MNKGIAIMTVQALILGAAKREISINSTVYWEMNTRTKII